MKHVSTRERSGNFSPDIRFTDHLIFDWMTWEAEKLSTADGQGDGEGFLADFDADLYLQKSVQTATLCWSTTF